MNWSIGKAATVGFALAAAVIVASAGLSYHNIRQLTDSESRVVHTHEVLNALRGVHSMQLDAESGQRGYLITGDAAYLMPYEAALTSMEKYLQRLEGLLADNPDQQRRLAALRVKTEAWLENLRKGIAARNEGGAESSRRFVLSGKSKQDMDVIRGLLEEMRKVERGLLVDRESESRTSYATALGTLLVTALLGLALVGTAYGLAAREVVTRRRSAESLRRANDELEERVRERTADLASANEALRRSNGELEQFASVASHDLQEPLRKIQAFGDRLQAKCADGLGEQGREYVQRMQASAARMRNLIDALLSFSRVTTKAQPFVSVDLTAAAREVVSDLEARIQQTGGRVEVGALPTVDADPLQMRQLLQNLVGNGLKFHRPGEAPVVRLESRLVNDNGNGKKVSHCEIAVFDNGIGFEEIYLDRIFEVFQRLHGRQEYEGTGIGLAICRKIVERHGGAITAKSVPGQGTTFLVTLPIQQPREESHDNEAGQTNHDPDGR